MLEYKHTTHTHIPLHYSTINNVTVFNVFLDAENKKIFKKPLNSLGT